MKAVLIQMDIKKKKRTDKAEVAVTFHELPQLS